MTVAFRPHPALTLSPSRLARGSWSAPLDLALLTRMARGDTRAMDTFCPRWDGFVRDALFVKEADVDIVEHIVADVFWQAWCGAPAFVNERGSVREWLLTLTRTTCVARCRQAGREIEQPDQTR